MIASHLSNVTTQDLLICMIYTLCIYLLSISLYRIFFHPLAKYPGPLSYKLSGWPLLWQAYTGNRHIWHLKDHEKYGPIVRIAPNTLSFTTASALHTIYAPSRTANVQKGEWYKTFDIAAGSYSSFTETDREKHAIKRRWMGPVFSTESLKVNEPLVLRVIERFCETLRPVGEEWGGNWDMGEMSTYLGFDIMGSLVFGCEFESVQGGERDLAKSVLPASMLMYWISYLPPVFLVRPLLRTKLFEMIGGKSVADNNRLIDYASSQVHARISDSGEKRARKSDFLSSLVGTQDTKTGWELSLADLTTEALNMMNAGADPFSSILAAAFFYLLQNPDTLTRATHEVRSTFPSPSSIINGPDLNSCTYLYACIEETLRLAAPVPSHLPRVVLSGGIQIDAEFLPPGTVVGVSMYTIHHSPTHFPSPFTFDPERWIESPSNPAESIAFARKVFNPFSIGARACSGRSLAYMQLKLTLAHLLWRFEFRLAEGQEGRGGGGKALGVGREKEDEYQLWDALGFGRDGPVVQVKAAA